MKPKAGQDADRGDFLDQDLSKENKWNKRKHFVLYLIITVIIVYIAVPTYGMIRDTVGPGEAVFVLDSPLLDARMNRPGPGILERIHDFLFPAKEVPVPVLQRIDLKGRVVYADRTPYAHGMVKLESAPRYTWTDAEGYFIFFDVAEGAHIVSVLDKDGNVLAKCDVEIERTMEIENVQLVRLSDGKLVFQVAVDVKVLEIVTLVLRTDDDGKVIGLEKVELSLEPEKAEEPLPPNPPAPPLPPAEPEEPPVPPVPPEEPEEPPDGPNPPSPPDNFGVFDTATTVRYGRESAVNVNIFGAKKRIAPGMRGSYQFTVDNSRNDHPTSYNVAFTAFDTLPATNKIPMVYRLKAQGFYVAGNDAAWCTVQELYQDAVLAGGEDVKYTLDWYWPEGERDNDYARFADNSGYSYSLMIKVKAQS